jgi:hypothetical protein
LIAAAAQASAMCASHLLGRAFIQFLRNRYLLAALRRSIDVLALRAGCFLLVWFPDRLAPNRRAESRDWGDRDGPHL